MLNVLTTDEFAEWFASLDESTSEDVATALEVVARLGPTRAAPESRESLLWYEHASAAQFRDSKSAAWDLEAWGVFRDYAGQVLKQLETPRFMARLSRLSAKDAALVLDSVREIKRATDPRLRWSMKVAGASPSPALGRPEDSTAEVRRHYLAALEAAGFTVEDVPAHTVALRELSRRLPAPGFRLLYGVHVERETALFVLGEPLNRSFYGDSVRRAESVWRAFLSGELRTVESAGIR